MQYEVVVPVAVRSAWDTLRDPDRLARCVPGLLLDEPIATGPDGHELTGRWKLRVATTTITYRGTLLLSESAAGPYTLTAVAVVTEVRGAAGNEAELSLRLVEEGAATRLVFDGALQASGRTAESGSGPLESALKRVADRFAATLAEEAAPAAGSTPPAGPSGEDTAIRARVPAPTPAPASEHGPASGAEGPDGARAADAATTASLTAGIPGTAARQTVVTTGTGVLTVAGTTGAGEAARQAALSREPGTATASAPADGPAAGPATTVAPASGPAADPEPVIAPGTGPSTMPATTPATETEPVTDPATLVTGNASATRAGTGRTAEAEPIPPAAPPAGPATGTTTEWEPAADATTEPVPGPVAEAADIPAAPARAGGTPVPPTPADGPSAASRPEPRTGGHPREPERPQAPAAPAERTTVRTVEATGATRATGAVEAAGHPRPEGGTPPADAPGADPSEPWADAGRGAGRAARALAHPGVFIVGAGLALGWRLMRGRRR